MINQPQKEASSILYLNNIMNNIMKLISGSIGLRTFAKWKTIDSGTVIVGYNPAITSSNYYYGFRFNIK